MIIDVHTHIVPAHFPTAPAGIGEAWPFMDHTAPGQANVMINGRNYRTVTDQCWSLPRRLSDLPGQGIDRQVLSPMPQLLNYRLSLEAGRDLARFLNEAIATMVAAEPGRFYGLGSVPLQDPEAAAHELASIKSLGLRGVEITTNVNGVSPGDARFLPFWREAAAQGLCVFMHAQDPTFTDRLVGPAYVANAVGFPVENTLAVASLLTGGVLEACPDLRVCCSHGAGGFPGLLPRIRHLWPGNDAMQKAMPNDPLGYARALFYDEVVFDTRAVRYLIDLMGVDRVLIGSDYPFMSRESTPDEEFDALGLSASEREAVGWRNCLRFLGVSEA